MGVEPTAARSARPATNFEDWGAHRDTATPICDYSQFNRPMQPAVSAVDCRNSQLLIVDTVSY